MQLRPALAGLACLLILGLAGCSKPVLDFRNAEIVNGKVYRSGADSPFTGTIANIPDRVLLGNQAVAMTIAQMTATALQAAGTTPLTMLSQGTLCDGKLSEGVPDGEFSCKLPQSDVVMLSVTLDKAVLDGKLTFRDRQGGVITELNFSHGLPDGKQEIQAPLTQKKVHVVNWNKGVLDGEESGYDAQTGEQILKATLVNGKYDGEFVQYAADGKRVIYKTTYVQGLKNGMEDQFESASGEPLSHGEWSNGEKNGTFKYWSNGKQTSEEKYDNGHLVSISDLREGQEMTTRYAAPAASEPEPGSACLDEWVAAFHKGNEDQPVTADQSSEFEEWCKQGKHPG